MKAFDVPQLEDAKTCVEMRAAIHRYTFQDSLTRSCMTAADLNGWSAEDRYTMLAYYALKERAVGINRMLELTALMPPRPIIFKSWEPGQGY